MSLSDDELTEMRAVATRTAKRILGDVDRAEDVGQETVARALAAPRGFLDRAPAEMRRLWARTTAQRLAVDAIRASESARFELLNTSPPPAGDEAAWFANRSGDVRRDKQAQVAGLVLRDALPPDADPEERADHLAVQKAVSKLSKRQQQVVYLRYFKDWYVVQIAEELEISSGTVKKYLHRALDELRNYLAE